MLVVRLTVLTALIVTIPWFAVPAEAAKLRQTQAFKDYLCELGRLSREQGPAGIGEEVLSSSPARFPPEFGDDYVPLTL